MDFINDLLNIFTYIYRKSEIAFKINTTPIFKM